MYEQTFVAFRTVFDAIKLAGGVLNVEITSQCWYMLLVPGRGTMHILMREIKRNK